MPKNSSISLSWITFRYHCTHPNQSKITKNTEFFYFYFYSQFAYFLNSLIFPTTNIFRFWPVIDNALRTAAIDRRVSVKLLISWWNHSRPAEDYFLNSLKDISSSYRGVDVQVV